MKLSDKKCQPCRGGVPPLTSQRVDELLQELHDWRLQAEHLQKKINTKDFQSALQLANAIGALAEKEQHHPDLLVRWGSLEIELWTHAINGLSEADFILAAKIDELLLKKWQAI